MNVAATGHWQDFMPQFTSSQSKICIGVSFKPLHFGAIRQDATGIDFFEVHAENYMGQGGLYHQQLQQLAENFELSIHGVGLSIGGTDPIDPLHLERLKLLCDNYHPAQVSEHLAWSVHRGYFLNDLLPLVYDGSCLKRVISRVNQIQNYLGRRLLLENPARYVEITAHSLDEAEFMEQVAAHTGCGLLLDINNLYVSASNLGFDPEHYLASFPLQHVGEIHLAGHSSNLLSDGSHLLIDDHGSPVADEVWRLFRTVVGRIDRKPTLIEWDNNLPEWPDLCLEADKARLHMTQCLLALDNRKLGS